MPRPALKSAKLPVQAALVSRMDAALSAAGQSCKITTDPDQDEEYPYIEVGDDDETERYTASTTGSTVDHSIRIRSRDSISAKKKAAIIIEDLMDHSRPIALDEAHYLVATNLAQNSLTSEHRPNGRDTHTATIRLEFRIGQH